jgi:hypothetical protein
MSNKNIQITNNCDIIVSIARKGTENLSTI